MTKLWRHPAALWVGGAAFLVGSLVYGSLGVASAGPTIAGTVIADQGTPGSQAWKVDGSGVTQPVSGTVSVGNLPTTQAVSGTVSIGNLPTTQAVSGTVSIGNLPTTQAVSGTVNIGNLPTTQQVSGTVTSGDTTGVITETQVVPTQAATNLVVGADVSSAREIRVSVTCGGSTNCSGLQIGVFVTTSKGPYALGYFNLLANGENSQTFDIPGSTLLVAAFGTDTSMTINTLVAGRSN